MSIYSPPPIQQPLTERTGLPTLQWILFFQGIFNGDSGTTWTPQPVGLGTVGTPTISGIYYKNAGFIDFYITISPGTNTSSVAGTTYIPLPFDVALDSTCFAVTGTQSVPGAINAAQDRVYPPTWTNLTSIITIHGRAVAKA